MPENRAPKLLAFAGSLRKDSFNKKLVHIAASGARQAGLPELRVSYDR